MIFPVYEGGRVGTAGPGSVTTKIPFRSGNEQLHKKNPQETLQINPKEGTWAAATPNEIMDQQNLKYSTLQNGSI